MSKYIKIEMNYKNQNLDQDILLRLVKCGRERCLADKKKENGQRTYYSLHYVRGGEGYLNVNSIKIRIGKGCIFLIRPNEEIQYYPDKNNPWEFIWVDFVGENLETVLARCALGENEHWVKPKTAATGDCFEKMVDAYFENGELFESTLLLIQILYRLAGECTARPRRNMNKIVRESILFINDNYSIDITLDIVAKSVGTSPNYLINAFTAEVGFSPMKYLMLFRIANACDLLREGCCSIKEISYRVGYRDPLYFSRCFSQIKGIPPRDYLQKGRSDDPWDFIKESNIDLDDRKGYYLSKPDFSI